MREEDLDWTIYHLITERESITLQEIEALVDVPFREIENSVTRLESYFLIERCGDSISVLSIQESLIRCQIKHTDNCPVYVENGVIKVKPEWRERK